jgi:hypothetical protein
MAMSVTAPHSATPDLVSIRFPKFVVHSLRPAARAHSFLRCPRLNLWFAAQPWVRFRREAGMN